MKEALDWTAIQAGYEAGYAIASLARDHGVSTSAIHKRAKRWNRPNGSRRPIGRSRDRAETLAKLLEQGFSERRAAHIVGLTLDKLADWKDDNPLLARHLAAVTAQGIHLEGHQLHGDWRAPEWNPAEQEPITVVLNVPRPEPYSVTRS